MQARNTAQLAQEAKERIEQIGDLDSFRDEFGITEKMRAEFSDRSVNFTWFNKLVPNRSDPIKEWDWQPAIQFAIEYVRSLGGGKVYGPRGIFGVMRPVITYSNITLKALDDYLTVFKALDDAVIGENEGVIQTADFLPDRNAWNYYEPYPEGIHMNVKIDNIVIDGNRHNRRTGNGICIYGGAWKLNVSVINCRGHGIWTECGMIGSSTLGDDWDDYINMHESYAGNVKISNCDKRGWYFKGPNDTYIHKLTVKGAGWAAFYQEKEGKSFAGGLKIGELHYYVCNWANDDPDLFSFISKASLRAKQVYNDTPLKNGMLLQGGASHIADVRTYKRNRELNGEYWGLVIDGLGIRIGAYYSANRTEKDGGLDGGDIWIKPGSSRTIISSCSLYGDDTSKTKSIGLLDQGENTIIPALMIQAYHNNPLSRGLVIGGNYAMITARIKQCYRAITWDDAISPSFGNMIKASLSENTIDFNSQNQYSNNVFEYWSDKMLKHVIDSKTFIKNEGLEDREWSSHIQLDSSKESNISVILRGATTMSAPLHPRRGQEITYRLYVGNDGGYPVYWASIFQTTWRNPADLTQIKTMRAWVTFVYTGESWEQKSYQEWFRRE